MPPQQPIQPNMQPNNNSKVNTILLVVIVILLSIGVYILWSKNNSTEKVFTPDSSEGCGFDGKKCLPSGQTNTNQNKNSLDNQSNDAQVPLTTITELNNRNKNIACSSALPDEGKTFTVDGYIYFSDLAYLMTGKRDGSNVDGFTIVKSTANLGDAGGLSVNITSDRSTIINTLREHYNPASTTWTHVLVTGKVHGFDMPIMGPCYVGVSLQIGSLKVLN